MSKDKACVVQNNQLPKKKPIAVQVAENFRTINIIAQKIFW